MSDLELLNEALAGEHFGIAAYTAALGTELLDDATTSVARAFRSDHETHRALLTKEILARLGTPVRALDPADYSKEYPQLETAEDVVAYAIVLEAAATRASIGSVAHYEDHTLALLAARIGGVEAQHWAALLAATGAHPVPAPIIEI